MLFKKCPKQFEYFYNDPKYDEYAQDNLNQSPALIRGSYFHNKVADPFFDNIDVEQIYDFNSKHIGEYFSYAVPETNDDLMQEWISYFLEYEQWRFEKIRDLTNSIDDLKKYFIPIAKEESITAPDIIDKTGHFDRIDYIPGTEDLEVVEYKTGKWYDMEQPNKVTGMNAEIGFYVTILQASNRFPNNNITHWKVINPTLRKVWRNKISKVTLTSVNRVYKQLCAMIIQKDEFQRNISDMCLRCPYLTPCHDKIRLGIQEIHRGESNYN